MQAGRNELTLTLTLPLPRGGRCTVARSPHHPSGSERGGASRRRSTASVSGAGRTRGASGDAAPAFNDSASNRTAFSGGRACPGAVDGAGWHGRGPGDHLV